ncbi:hypothetical protein ZIOFF_010887 [Zingiber officinale]|uniref:Uncharacterized protein n=1 Tax=Zingiber officinale TaxID=94328 RepID=A0A8J5HJT7_ZINOF|nr:hypothetical protein ZIOFF_010887 [Zingiber officinale]
MLRQRWPTTDEGADVVAYLVATARESNKRGTTAACVAKRWGLHYPHGVATCQGWGDTGELASQKIMPLIGDPPLLEFVALLKMIITHSGYSVITREHPKPVRQCCTRRPSFKKVVQKLTGSTETMAVEKGQPQATTAKATSPEKSSAVGFSPWKRPDLLSPACWISPPSKWAEDLTIAGKGFYLHPSPGATPDMEPPRLLPLFPMMSPKVISFELSLTTPHSATY